MFAAYCQECRRKYLLPLSDVLSMRRIPEGIEIGFQCLCNHRGTFVTGRPAAYLKEIS